MIFNDKKITLKDGTIAILKTPDIKDAEMMLYNIKTASGETDFLTRYPEFWDDVSLESEENWIRSMRESENNLVIACYIDEKPVGSCDITFFNGCKSFHRAGLGISITKKYWNLGIGSAMFEALLETAQNHGGTEIVELEFIEGNDRAKALYEKFGFEVVSVKPKYCKLKDGTYQNLVYMQKYL
ncbi:MAG: GNAT family N-acetyltransferase [Clostridia bacterium]|nr:GNAT family N-acetyltransferase [Clostridia bacterium]